jgi:hypothetical protein
MDSQGTPGWATDSEWDNSNMSQHANDALAPQAVPLPTPMSTEALLMQMFTVMCDEAAEAHCFQCERAITTSMALESMTAAIHALNTSSVPTSTAAVPAEPRR